MGFLGLNVPYIVPSFGKIVGAVSEKLPLRTGGGDSIGPFGFQPGTNISAFQIFDLIDKTWTFSSIQHTLQSLTQMVEMASSMEEGTVATLRASLVSAISRILFCISE